MATQEQVNRITKVFPASGEPQGRKLTLWAVRILQKRVEILYDILLRAP